MQRLIRRTLQILLAPRRHPPTVHIIDLRLARGVVIEPLDMPLAHRGALDPWREPRARGRVDVPDIFERGGAFGAEAVLREAAVGGEAVDVQVAVVLAADGVAHGDAGFHGEGVAD